MLKRNKTGTYTIRSKAEAEEALRLLEEIEEEISPKMIQATELKKAATAYAVDKKLDTIQLDGCYYRQITRYTRFWVGTDEDVPAEQAGVKSLQALVKGKKANGKPLWQLITKRVPDPDKISEAVGKGWIEETEIEQAFVEKPQRPFLQRFTGDADGGS
jgi:hypothetical protein